MSGETLTSTEKNALLALMAEAREVSNKELEQTYGFTLTGKERERLNERKLVGSRKEGRTFVHELLDDGWVRCRDVLTAPRPARGNIALHAVLAGLNRYLEYADVSLADIFSHPSQSIELKIMSVYRGLAKRRGAAVRLAELRRKLNRIDADTVTDALRRMHENGSLVLIPEEDQKRLKPEDRSAAVVIGLRSFHMMAVETP